MSGEKTLLVLDKDALARQRERTKIIREAVAGEVFSRKNVSDLLSDSSSRGQTSAVFEPQEPMDLSETMVARAAVETFHKAGFHTEWKTRHRPDCEPERYLRVSWGKDAKNG